MDEEKIVEQEELDDSPMQLVVDDGRIDIPVQNSLGERIGTFRFNPSDVNIVNRYNEIADKFGEVLKPLIDADIDANGAGEDESSVQLLNEAEAKTIDLMDYMLNGDAKAAFFEKVHMFSPVNGKFYCENVFESIGQFISKKFEKEVKRINVRVEKHTHGYRTGKHRKGDR